MVMSVANNLLVGFLGNAALAAGAAAGFGLSFSVPMRVLWLCAAGGAFGRGLRFLLVESNIGMGVEWASFFAAALTSTVGVLAAQKLRAHPKAFTVAAMIPMIPGVSIFTALIAIAKIQHSGMTLTLLETAINSGLRAFFVVIALTVGLAAPGLLFYRRRPLI